MTSGGTIGAATAVNAQGEKASEKVISYMREEMAATAEANNKSRKIAAGMVDENLYIPFINYHRFLINSHVILINYHKFILKSHNIIINFLKLCNRIYCIKF